MKKLILALCLLLFGLGLFLRLYGFRRHIILFALENFAADEKRRRTRRMLMGLSRDMTVWAKSGGAIVGWRNGIEPYIAYRQQEGGVEQ